MSELSTGQPDFWPDSGLNQIRIDTQGWLVPQPAYWLRYLQRPELALVPESCAAETRLHRSLHRNPLLQVNEASLALLADADVRDNYRTFVRFRDAVLASGTLESFYLSQLEVQLKHPPLFIDMLVQTITHHLVRDSTDAVQVRAAELLFR